MEKIENVKGKKEEGSSILKAAWLIALVTILSKVVGFLRDVITAKYYGTTWQSDAYFYAYQIPSFAIILLGGVGGPLHSATVAVFSKLIPDLNEKPSDFVNKLYNTFLVASVLFFMLLGILFFIFAPQVMEIIINIVCQHFAYSFNFHKFFYACIFDFVDISKIFQQSYFFL